MVFKFHKKTHILLRKRFILNPYEYFRDAKRVRTSPDYRKDNTPKCWSLALALLQLFPNFFNC
jgi:hypothetical protein